MSAAQGTFVEVSCCCADWVAGLARDHAGKLHRARKQLEACMTTAP